MNNVAYFEIQADEPEKLAAFYIEVFGWSFAKDPMIPVEYWRIQSDGILGGLLKRPSPAPNSEKGANAFVCSIMVENFDATAQKILKEGGKVALEKFAVVGKCWQGYFVDPQGNAFGIFEVDEKAA
jgi:predicted enzyme related to lactoylglutathione lyase